MAAGGKLLTPAEVAAKLPSLVNREAADMVDRMLRLLASSLKNAIELGLLETLMAAGSKLLTPAEVAAKLPSVANREAADMVDHMLRLLASYNVVSCRVEEGKDGRLSRRYGAAPVCKFPHPQGGRLLHVGAGAHEPGQSWRAVISREEYQQRQQWRREAATVVACNQNSTEISHREQLKQRALAALGSQ